MRNKVNSERDKEKKASLQYAIGTLLLILTTVLWGSTFIITKNITQEVAPFWYLGLRFLLALLLFLPFLPRMRRINKRVIRAGIITGFIYFISIAVQTIGLQLTSAGKAGFITGLNTLIVPFISWGFYKRKVKKHIWIAVFLSIGGMAFLLLDTSVEFLIGDILVLLCAFGFAFYIISVDRNINYVDIYVYLIIQLIIITSLSFLMSFLTREDLTIPLNNLNFWGIMIYMGTITSGLTFLFQNWGQKKVGPHITAVIFTLEPVFALLFASVIIGSEELTIREIIGCVFIFIAILIVVLKRKRKK